MWRHSSYYDLPEGTRRGFGPLLLAAALLGPASLSAQDGELQPPGMSSSGRSTYVSDDDLVAPPIDFGVNDHGGHGHGDEIYWDDADFVLFPEDEAPLLSELIEKPLEWLTWPDEPLAHFFSHITFAEHDEIESELEEHAIGLQAIPPRPPLLLEWNERFLSPGWLNQGIETPTGAIWRPAVWVFGTFRSAFQYFDPSGPGDPVVEWANRLDLFGQLNLSGTERLLVGLRPFDEERGSFREFSSVDFNSGNGQDGFNADFQTLFFEGDIGEIFPRWDPYDVNLLDYGFSVGRMPLLAQQGLLINEDAIDAVTLTRNTLNGAGNLNFRTTGVYSWNAINRNSPTAARQNDYDTRSEMVAVLTESDFAVRTVNADVAYVTSEDARFGDLLAFGVSSIRRFYGYHNTYNTSFHFLSSHPTNGATAYSQEGQLLFGQTSWTPHHTHDLVYLNGFWAIDRYTSPARGVLMGGALGQTGILYAGSGVGRAGAPLGVRTNDIAGGSLGYQMFFDCTRQQVICEVGGFTETEGPTNRGAIAGAVRYQRAMGQHMILILDGAVAKRESRNVSQGARAEILVKF